MFGLCTHRASSFEFSDRSLASRHAAEEYRHVKRLFLSAREILRSSRRRNALQAVADMQQLLVFYERSGAFMCLLVNEVFRMSRVEEKHDVFEIMNKLLRLFFLFDVDRMQHVQVFHDYAVLVVYGRQSILPMSEMLKIATFSAISMPMGRLFMTYFSTEAVQIHHPAVLCKRAPIHLCAERRTFLELVSRVMCRHRKRHAALFFCALYEAHFGGCIEDAGLLPDEQLYYAAVRRTR